MNGNVETLLHEELQTRLEELKGMDVGSDEYKAAVDNITKLMDRGIKIDELNLEDLKRTSETNVKMSQIKEDHKDRFWKHILEGVGIAAPLCLTVWGTLKSLKFEETGTVTTIVGRGFLNKLLPRK